MGRKSPRKKDKNGLTEMQKHYVDARLQGLPIKQCKRIAGYNPTIPTQFIERPGNGVWLTIRKSIESYGMTDDFIAKEIRQGINLSKKAVTRFNPKTGESIKDPDLHAHDKYLSKICKLKGYERDEPTKPSVAIQINNQFPGLAQLAPGEIEILVKTIRNEIMARESTDIPSGSPETENPTPCPGMDTTNPNL